MRHHRKSLLHISIINLLLINFELDETFNNIGEDPGKMDVLDKANTFYFCLSI